MKTYLMALVVLVAGNLEVWAEGTNSVTGNPDGGVNIRELSVDDMQAKMGGVGIAIKTVTNGVSVLAVLPGTPACEAGMKAGDIVTQIDSASTKGMKLPEAVNRMRGAVGSEVKLVVLRLGQAEPMTLKLVRREISVSKGGAKCGGEVFDDRQL